MKTSELVDWGTLPPVFFLRAFGDGAEWRFADGLDDPELRAATEDFVRLVMDRLRERE